MISKQFSYMVYRLSAGEQCSERWPEGLLHRRQNNGMKSPRAETHPVEPPREDYASIECLVLFLSQ